MAAYHWVCRLTAKNRDQLQNLRVWATFFLAGRHAREIGSSKVNRKFQAALPDSQINDSKVSAMSAYPVIDW